VVFIQSSTPATPSLPCTGSRLPGLTRQGGKHTLQRPKDTMEREKETMGGKAATAVVVANILSYLCLLSAAILLMWHCLRYRGPG